MDRNATDFFTHVVLSALRHREKTGEVRDDFLQLMIEARNGQLKAVEESELSAFEKEAQLKSASTAATTKSRGGKQDKVVLTDEMIVAQSILFLLAGFETTQNALLFTVYELALNPEIQDTLAEEVANSLRKDDGKFLYDSINHLEYLDKVVSESLRKYPPAIRFERRAATDYKIPGSDLVIPKDTLVIFPSYGIQHDEEYFPNPEKFDPERFSPEAKATRHAYSYQPFGHGPRNCIGSFFNPYFH